MKTIKLVTTQIKAKEYQSLIDPEAVRNYYSRMISNKCSNDMYVIGVKSIVERSPWAKLADTRYPGAQASIRAEVEGLTAPADYVIAGCKVLEVTNTNIAFSNSYVNGLCPKTPETAFVKKGMIIPMRVVDATYIGDRISISARIFRHDWRWPVVAILPGEPISIDFIDDIKEKAQKIAKEREVIFKLMQPSKNIAVRKDAKPLSSLPVTGTLISLCETLDGNYYETTDANYSIILPAGEAALYLARLYVCYCECAIQMAQDYADDATIKNHMGLFRYIGISQK